MDTWLPEACREYMKNCASSWLFTTTNAVYYQGNIYIGAFKHTNFVHIHCNRYWFAILRQIIIIIFSSSGVT